MNFRAQAYLMVCSFHEGPYSAALREEVSCWLLAFEHNRVRSQCLPTLSFDPLRSEHSPAILQSDGVSGGDSGSIGLLSIRHHCTSDCFGRPVFRKPLSILPRSGMEELSQEHRRSSSHSMNS